MPWVSLKQYAELIRTEATALALIDEVARLRGQLAQTETKLDAEIARNREREDRFLDRTERLVDRVVVSKGAYPVVTAAEKKAAKAPSSAIPLSALEEAQLKMYIESATEHGYGQDVARRMFERDRRKKLEPAADLSAYNDLPIIKPLDEIVDDFSDVTEAAG